MYWISERRLPGSSATTASAVGQAECRARGGARRLERDRVGQRMADVGGRHAVRAQQLGLERETGTAHGRSCAAILLHPPAAPGPDRRADEVDRLDAGRLQPRLEAEVEVGRVDADEGRPGARRSRRSASRRGCRRSRGSGAAPRHSRAPPACRSATRLRSPVRAICGPPMPAARQSRPARLQAPQQQAGEQVARGFAGDHRQRASAVHRFSARCRGSARRGSRAACTSTSPPPASWPRSAAIAARLACSSVSPSRYSSRCICLTRAMRSREKPRRRRPSTLKPCIGQRVAGDHHERRHVLRDMALEAGHRMRADRAELVHAGQPADDDPVADVHVAGQRGVVGQDRVAADLHVVRDVHVGHDPVVVADARDAGVLRGAAVEGAELADRVAVADRPARSARRGTSCPAARRRATACGKMRLSRPIVVGPSITQCAPMRRALADLRRRRRSPRRARPSPSSASSRRASTMALSGGSWRHRRQATLRIVHISSASTAVSPSTLARVLYL